MSDSRHSVLITPENWEPDLKFNWGRPEFSAEDGIGSLDSLHQAGDGIVAVGGFVDEQIRGVGSGVMVAPGLILTATHVLKEFPKGSDGPVFCTFLPDGAARAWLPYESNTVTGPGLFVGFGTPEKPLICDVSLVSCVLVSEAHEHHPMMIAPLELELPLPNQRLWAVGFREGELVDGATGMIPFVSSGLVSTCYPHGRGRHLASTCVEVAMDTVGGMSGGPVFNEDGRVVGIVSASLSGDDGLGPTYVTLIWDAMRIGVRSPWPRGLWPKGDTDLLKARDLGLAQIKGGVRRDVEGNVVLDVSSEAMQILLESTPPLPGELDQR